MTAIPFETGPWFSGFVSTYIRHSGKYLSRPNLETAFFVLLNPDLSIHSKDYYSHNSPPISPPSPHSSTS